jgi:hypothetical protein
MAARSSAAMALLRQAAGTPLATSVSTWSFINEMSGEITRASPSRTRAGAWKQTDLPPPVGSTSSESRPLTTASIASRWRGRNEV